RRQATSRQAAQNACRAVDTNSRRTLTPNPPSWRVFHRGIWMTNTVDWNLPDTWGELGKDWWLENGRLAGCTDEQVRFAVLRHSGASATQAARGAGYSFTNAAALRQAAYRAARSTGVMNLLSLATASDGLGEGAISDAEVDSKLAKLV